VCVVHLSGTFEHFGVPALQFAVCGRVIRSGCARFHFADFADDYFHAEPVASPSRETAKLFLPPHIRR
jgi:hypothetical protein